jgi:hypothetical protein
MLRVDEEPTAEAEVLRRHGSLLESAGLDTYTPRQLPDKPWRVPKNRSQQIRPPWRLRKQAGQKAGVRIEVHVESDPHVRRYAKLVDEPPAVASIQAMTEVGIEVLLNVCHGRGFSYNRDPIQMPVPTTCISPRNHQKCPFSCSAPTGHRHEYEQPTDKSPTRSRPVQPQIPSGPATTCRATP